MKTKNNGQTESDYIRFKTPEMEPFDPVRLARRTEQIVCDGNRRKYTDFYATGVYGGIATGYTVGCCLRCVYCWVDWSRDFPEQHGEFYSPEEAFAGLERAAHKAGVSKLRTSGAEPTLGREHLLGLLEQVEKSRFGLFILETNGILFGADASYAEEVARFRKVHVRVGLKAGTPQAFERNTGAMGEAFEIPFQGVRNLREAGASFHVASMSADPRFLSKSERRAIHEKLASIDPVLVRELEEEIVDPYPTTIARLKYAALID